MMKCSVQMWMACPLALYIGERIYGLFRAHYWDTQVMDASILDSGVLTLELTKPHNFSYMCDLLTLPPAIDLALFSFSAQVMLGLRVSSGVQESLDVLLCSSCLL